MICAFNSLVNGGYYYEPHMVEQIQSADGAVIENIEPRVLKQTVSASTSEQIIEYCNGVVINGTGKRARPAGYAIGGKTGTSQTNSGSGVDHSVFIAFAPFDKPEIAISVVLEHGASTYTVTSIAKAVLDSYFFASSDNNTDIPPYTVLE